MLPFWLALFLLSVGSAAGVIGTRDRWSKGLVIVAAIVGHVAISRYYRRRFGNVRPATSVGRAVLIALIIVVPFFGFIFLDEIGVMPMPLHFPALTLATLCLARAFSTQPRLLHWIPAAIAIALVSQLPLTSWPPAIQSNAWTAVAGLAFVAAAYKDHRVLMERFRDAGFPASQTSVTHG